MRDGGSMADAKRVGKEAAEDRLHGRRVFRDEVAAFFEGDEASATFGVFIRQAAAHDDTEVSVAAFDAELAVVFVDVADMGEELEFFLGGEDGGDEIDGRFYGVAGDVLRAAETLKDVGGDDLLERLVLQQRVLAFFKEQQGEPRYLALRWRCVGDERRSADEVL